MLLPAQSSLARSSPAKSSLAKSSPFTRAPAKPFPVTLWMVVLLSLAPAAQAEIGVSVTIDQPGIYGRIDLGHVPAPELVYEQPVIVEQVRVVEKPIYLHVPPGHLKHWSKHCHQYQACARRVYFVKEEWYEKVYAPAKRQHQPGYQQPSVQSSHDQKKPQSDQQKPEKKAPIKHSEPGMGNGQNGQGMGMGSGHDH